MQKMKETRVLIDYRCNYCATFRRFLKFQNVFNTKLPITQLLRFLMYFSLGINNENMAELLDISDKTLNTLVLATQNLIK
ncbi:hypothetical protein PAPHI01_2631 [Pancytospora philotis]|nr:hypothetical protein PAPHI01_2631 [Pancytospora philotis]